MDREQSSYQPYNHVGQKEVEKVEDVVSWEMVVAKYIQLQGGQIDASD